MLPGGNSSLLGRRASRYCNDATCFAECPLDASRRPVDPGFSFQQFDSLIFKTDKYGQSCSPFCTNRNDSTNTKCGHLGIDMRHSHTYSSRCSCHLPLLASLRFLHVIDIHSPHQIEHEEYRRNTDRRRINEEGHITESIDDHPREPTNKFTRQRHE